MSSPLVGSVDQGTSSTRFSVYDSVSGEVVAFHQEESIRYEPEDGWCEMDPEWITGSVRRCMEEAIQKLKEKNIDLTKVKCIGITNQMATIIVWDKLTGKPFYNAIEWMDVRTHEAVEKILDKLPHRNKDHFRKKTGQPLSSIFWYTKFPWIMENVPDVIKALDDGRCMIGTVNTWILWNLTGGVNGGKYLTDVTNCCFTGLCNNEAGTWDKDICEYFNIPVDTLPEVRGTSEIYGHVVEGSLEGVPISGMLGDQMAGTTGQLCFEAGQSKVTYGTAGCININTGTKIIDHHGGSVGRAFTSFAAGMPKELKMAVYSSHGLMTGPLYKLGKSAPIVYNLMGAIGGFGAMIRWLRDNLQIIKNASEIETLAGSVDSSHDCFVVPAFDGLLCPFWEDDARGAIVGLSTYTRKEHICRAALESCCFQIRSILEDIQIDTGFPIPVLKVDGGMVVDNLMMQIQADFIGENIVRPLMIEATSLGAALMAGAASDIGIFQVRADKLGLDVKFPIQETVFKPKMADNERNRLYKRWQKAVEKARHWKGE